MDLNFRKIHESDWQNLFKWRNDSIISEHLGSQSMTEERARKFIEMYVTNETNYGWVIEIGNREAIGYCTLEGVDRKNNKCEVGVIVGESKYHGKGIGKRAFQFVTERAFTDFKMHRVFAVASDENPASIGALQSIGFQLEGRMRDANYKRGKYNDLVLLSVLRSEWNT